jgi:hypothetical protein
MVLISPDTVPALKSALIFSTSDTARDQSLFTLTGYSPLALESESGNAAVNSHSQSEYLFLPRHSLPSPSSRLSPTEATTQSPNVKTPCTHTSRRLINAKTQHKALQHAFHIPSSTTFPISRHTTSFVLSCVLLCCCARLLPSSFFLSLLSAILLLLGRSTSIPKTAQSKLLQPIYVPIQTIKPTS